MFTTRNKTTAARNRITCTRLELLSRSIFNTAIVIFLLVMGVQVQATQQPSPSPTPQKSKKKLGIGVSPVDLDVAHRNQGNAQPENIEGDHKQEHGEFVFAPIPMHSPAIGAGLALGLGYIFKLNKDDKDSPPSAIGVGTLFTSNSTRGGAVGAKLYLKRDLYRVTLGGGRARVNYDFFGSGIIAGNAGRFIPLTSRGTALFGEMLRRVKGKLYVGGRVQYRKLSVAIRPQDGDSEGRPVIDNLELDARTVALGLKTTRDTRNDTFYPTKGSLFDFTSDFFDQAWGSRFEYQVYKADFNRYHTLTPRHVLAYRAMGCAANGRVPFYDLCLYGAMNDLRGYTAGRYQDRRMFATQAEYRVELPKRFGLVAFGGFGGVARHLNEFRLDQLLPAAGAGARFRLTKESHVNFRVDLAVGRTGHTVTIGVGEAF